MRPSGGVIGASVLPTAASAKGMWTLAEAERARRAITWPGSRTLEPSDVQSADLLLWFAADKETGFSDGNAVSSLANFGVGSAAAAFGTGPTFKTAILNNKPVYRFNNTAVRTNDSYALTDWTFFVVFKNTSGNESFERLVDHDYVNGFWFGRNDASSTDFGGGVKESSSPYGRFVSTTSSGWNIIGNRRSGTTHQVWNDGNWATRSSGTGLNGTATSSNKIGIGGWYNNSSQYAANIDMAEIVMYDIALTDSEREKLEGYLAWKYALSSSLPAGHPYKDAAPSL